MTQDTTIHHNRLKSLHGHVKAVRNAQRAFFSLPKVVSQEQRNGFLQASKQAEKALDAFMQQIEYEKLV
ncbi:MAG: hypothetical protein Q8L89_04325 [Gammaproteobacteria bacterium]|nr:hypothetical protein [Gammaproteobacteria bacterium]